MKMIYADGNSIWRSTLVLSAIAMYLMWGESSGLSQWAMSGLWNMRLIDARSDNIPLATPPPDLANTTKSTCRIIEWDWTRFLLIVPRGEEGMGTWRRQSRRYLSEWNTVRCGECYGIYVEGLQSSQLSVSLTDKTIWICFVLLVRAEWFSLHEFELPV